MALIKPISDLRNKSQEISTLAHSVDEPIFITKNGEGDLVVMSISHYRKLQHKLDLLQKLSVAEALRHRGDEGKLAKDIIKELRESLHDSTTTI